MRTTISRAGAALVARLILGLPRGERLVRLRRLPAGEALEAFLAALKATPPDAPTACDGWTAHDLLAHMTAGSVELAELVELRLVGATRPTRGFVEREAPYAALPDAVLRRRFVVEGLRLTSGLSKLRRRGLTIEFTGTTLSAEQIDTHAISELVLHRFDLVGLDATARRHLADPHLAAHAEDVIAQMDDGVRPVPSGRTGGPAEALLAVWGR